MSVGPACSATSQLYTQETLDTLVIGKGYAGLCTSDQSCQVLINPHKISMAAAEAVFRRLFDQPSQLIICCVYRTTWQCNVHTSKSEALHHLLDVVQRAHRPTRDQLLSRELAPHSLAQSGTPALADVLQLIESHQRRLTPELLNYIIQLTGDRYVICRWDAQSHHWRIQSAGSGYRQGFITLRSSEPILLQPARDYARWVHDRYSTVSATGAPVVEHIDAMVSAPNAARRRMQYCRIIAPLTDSNGEEILLSTSIRDSTIDLGVNTGPETPAAPQRHRPSPPSPT